MRKFEYLSLALFGLVIILVVSAFQGSPGYMDADYYMAGGISLAKGSGFYDLFLWNYLDNPGGIPHPSHAYWMPLASLVSAMGMISTGMDNFSSARLFFLLISAAIAPLTASLSFSIYQNRKYALLAGAFAAVPGFYLAYLGTTDTFALSMVLGCTWLLVAGHPGFDNSWKYAVLGFIAGLLHLSRADGIVWIILGIVSIVFLIDKNFYSHNQTERKYLKLFLSLGALIGGYLSVMGPWMLRNWNAFGTLLSPGGLRTLWLVSYDDIYAYPGDLINFTRWLGSGISNILDVRWQALLNNFQTAFAVQGVIFLTPMVIIGLWKARNHNSVKIGGLFWLISMIIMTVIFPHVGWRGGFFHSGAAVQPLLWAVAPKGLDEFIRLGVRYRRWNWRHAWLFFSTASLVILILVTFESARNHLIGSSVATNLWNQSANFYSEIESVLETIGVSESDIVMVNNPPGFHIATGRVAISIPDGSLQTTLTVAERYAAKYLILEPNHPKGLESIYNHTEGDRRLVYLTTVQNTHIYLLKPIHENE